MIRFIWQNWWRQKERFILIIVGALIVSVGLSYLVGLSQANKGTIVNDLQKRWTASYDIVVRPPGSRSVTEKKKLFEPDYLSGLSGGISLAQYHKIQKINGISVAAPIAMIGYADYDVALKNNIQINKTGLYREHIYFTTDLGPLNKKVIDYNYYFPIGWNVINKSASYGVGLFDGNLRASTSVLLAGIDPKQEAKLTGLDGAVLKNTNSRYFSSNDKSLVWPAPQNGKEYQIPILVNEKEYVDETYRYTIQRLDLPFDNPYKTMNMVKSKGGSKYLDTVKGRTIHKYTFHSKDAQKTLIEGITGINPNTGKMVQTYGNIRNVSYITEKPSPLKLRAVSSPFPKKWPYAYEVKIQHEDHPPFSYINKNNYRSVKLFGKSFKDLKRIRLNYIGIYDPGKLKISKDPLTELPMETYRPASADLVLNAKNKPVNPPVKMKPEDDSFGLLTRPPSMLTTIDAAAKILGDKPISAIRIRVAGVNSLSKKSEKKLESIKKKIEDETGLIADITLGSSPQPALTHVPAKGSIPELGWIQQPWVKLGASFSIFREAKIGFSGVIGSVIFVAIIYVFASCLVSLLARRREFAVLLAIGWQPRQLAKMMFLESVLIGGFVAIIAWTILGWILSIHHTETSSLRLFLTGFFGFVIYGLGTIVPAILATRIAPHETLRSGEVSKASRRVIKTRSIVSMACNQMLAKWRRSLLSIISIAVSTGLLTFFLFITFRLKGVMYTTWLGQYVALQVGPTQYVAMAVAVLIAILTTVEIMWQNVSERQPEIALAKAIGWRSDSVRLLVLLEGGFSGLWAGVIGLLLAFGLIWFMYGSIPYNQLWFLLATGVIPIATGLLGAAIPAERAVRILPSQGVRGQYENLKKTENRFRWVLGVAAAVLVIGFVVMVVRLAPDVTHKAVKKTEPVQGHVSGTTGKVHHGKVKKADSNVKQ